MTHQYQHPDAPTWCIHCGTFQEHCRDGEQCSGKPHAWDAETADGNLRIVAAFSGREIQEAKVGA